MRVLHLSSGNLYGGIETMLVTMARHRHECPELHQEFGLCFEGRVADELHATKADVHLFGDVRLSRPSSVWRVRRRLRAVLGKSSIDFVVCHGPWAMAVFGPAARSVRLPVVLWAHAAHTGRHWIERLAAMTRPELVIANSTYSARSAVAWLSSTPSTVIHCPVDGLSVGQRANESRAAVRHALATDEASVVIVLAGRMEAWKGHRELLASLGTMADNPHWHCWIVGGPQRPHEAEYFNSLVQLARTLRIGSRVQFCGQRSDVRALLAAADLYCQPNIAPEPFGISFVEAMSCGLPVVSTAFGGALEIVDDSCGILIPPDDTAGLTHALTVLVADKKLRDQLGCAGSIRATTICDPQARLVEFAGALRHINGPVSSRNHASGLFSSAVR